MAEQDQSATRDFMQALAETVDFALNGDRPERRFGFALLVFPFGSEERRANYVSNASRDDMIVAIKEWLARAEGRVMQTPERPQ